MPSWTPEQLQAYEQRILKRQVSYAKAGDSGIRTTEPECLERRPLVCPAPREAPSNAGPPRCDYGSYRVIFRVYAVRPLDWDNYRLKSLQDCLVEVGFLPSDDWRTLEGQVISCKAHTKKEERTEVSIEQL